MKFAGEKRKGTLHDDYHIVGMHRLTCISRLFKGAFFAHPRGKEKGKELYLSV